MCGRFTLKTPTDTVRTLFPGLSLPELTPRYNIAPTQDIACVRRNVNENEEFAWLRWGLIPFWAKDLKIGAKMINARAETVAEKPSFRNAFKNRRCLVLADGYFEWKKEADGKQPYYVTKAEEPSLFCMAGLWESWNNKETDQRVESCTIITTDAAPSLSKLHDRMPVILEPDAFEFWLDTGFSDSDHLQKLLKPIGDGAMQATAVSKTVNNARNDNLQCVQPV